MPDTLELSGVSRSFDGKPALAGVDLRVGAGSVVALLGPNGAGKTTLLRVITGLLAPDEGSVVVDGIDAAAHPAEVRRHIGFFPSGDRTFYNRISGIENLVFFGRLYGLSRKEALARARTGIDAVGLNEAARKRVGLYSHGMQKRLAVARALLMTPPVLLIDEATHDLDPDGAQRVKELVRRETQRGAAVLWTTQRLEEIRGFADGVVLIDRGQVRFRGTVEELMLRSAARTYLVRLQNGAGPLAPDTLGRLDAALGDTATVRATGADVEHFRLVLGADAVLGDVLIALSELGVSVLDCTQARSEIEEAFLRLTGEPA